MIRSVAYIMCSILSCLLGSCDTQIYQVKEQSECLGEWQMIGKGNEEKSIVLRKDGTSEFNNISIEDIACEGDWMLPKTGTWKVVSAGKGIEIWFEPNGSDYGQGGDIHKTPEGLEWWFVLGDPDSYDFKKFRLKK